MVAPRARGPIWGEWLADTLVSIRRDEKDSRSAWSRPHNERIRFTPVQWMAWGWEMSGTASVASVRIRSLDGLRGIAALVVLFHHALLVVPSLNDNGTAATGWLVVSPLHLVWAGEEAVFVFFILSGIVLALPVLRGTVSWAAYYPARLLRLYLPVAASVAIAVVLAAVVARKAVAGESNWMALHNVPLSVMAVVRDLVLVTGLDSLNSPLWSLQWEVLFSLLLPAYVWVAVKLRRLWLLAATGSAVLTVAGFVVGVPAVEYLPMFMIGVVLATKLPVILDRVPAMLGGWRGWLVFAAALLAITAHWLVIAIYPAHAFAVALPFILVGAAVLVVLAAAWPPLIATLSRSFPQWMGRISFSLYLTHEPVIVSVGKLLPVQLAWVVPIIAIPISVVVAVIFFRLVEAPAHRLAQRAGRSIRTRRAVATR